MYLTINCNTSDGFAVYDFAGVTWSRGMLFYLYIILVQIKNERLFIRKESFFISGKLVGA